MSTDLRTQAIVLRRTNYGETDRIISFLTPSGKVTALARSVRKEKSRLAGAIELFSISDIVIHQGRKNTPTLSYPTSPASTFPYPFPHTSAPSHPSPSAPASTHSPSLSTLTALRTPLGILTSAKMLKFYQNIISNLPSLELASACLKRIDRAAEQTDNPEYFDLLTQVFAGLERAYPINLIEIWFRFNLARASGEELNLHRDTTGAPLDPTLTYLWDFAESALRPAYGAPISAPEIKFARLLWAARLDVVARIADTEPLLLKVAHLVS